MTHRKTSGRRQGTGESRSDAVVAVVAVAVVVVTVVTVVTVVVVVIVAVVVCKKERMSSDVEERERSRYHSHGRRGRGGRALLPMTKGEWEEENETLKKEDHEREENALCPPPS
jgi:uncharacterized protein HemY